MSQAEAIALVRDFAREQFVSKGMVADINIHWGQSAAGEAQPHAHIMLTMRRVVPGPDGLPEAGVFGLKERAWDDRALLLSWRARWAEMTNERLAVAGAGAATRIDHRSNADRGIDLEPQNKIGPAGARRAVRGEDAERADEHRAIARRNGERLLAAPELALQVLTRQQSTFTRADLARLVHRHSDGAAQFAAVMAKVEASPELVRVGKDGRDRARYSTREMVQVERRMEAAALELSRRTTHAVSDDRRRALLASTSLGAEQQLAFSHVTTSGDVAVVVGYAGSGKSTVLGPTRQALEAEGYSVRGAALSGIAAEGLEAGSGIASRTIASWEHAWAQGNEQLGARDVLVLDEAGMVGSRQMERVLSAVLQAGAKLVLVGDYEQLQAIEAGAAFRAITERVGAAEITEVFRQHETWQRQATKDLARGNTAEALATYGRAGMVRAHATDEAARAALIADWQKARIRAPGESQIILAHSRDEVRALNEAARAARRAAGELGEDRLLPTELGMRQFATGDRVYFLRNERGLGVKNGTLGTVMAIEGEGEAARLTVRLDREDPKTGDQKLVAFRLSEYADLDHGYAATVHKSQSVTVDRTYVLATPGMDRHLAYVALSRHRQSVALHWSKESFQSAAGLSARLSRERGKDTTLDYGESEEELLAAYAERRGLHPVAPATSQRAVAAPGRSAVPARGRLRRVQLASEIGTVLSALWHAIEAQKTAIATIADQSAADLSARLSRERAKDTTLDHGESKEELLAAPGRSPAPGRGRLRRVQLASEIGTVLSALRHAIEAQKTAIATIAESLVRTRQAPKQKPAPRDMFDGLVLNTTPLSIPAPVPEPSPLATAIAEFLVALRDAGQRVAAGLPLLPHQKTAYQSAHQKIDALRPGFKADLVTAIGREPRLMGQAEQGAEGMAALIAAGEQVRADREGAARRQAEDAELAPIRERLLKERMEAWWRETHSYIYSWERSDQMRNEARPVEEALKRDIERMPAAELRRIERDWAEAERISAAAEASGPRRSGPSPF